MLPDQSFTRNAILSSLLPADWTLLQPHLQRIELSRGFEFFAADTPVEHVYFLEGGVASIVCECGGEEVEVGLVGREGFTASFMLMGTDRSPDKSFVQIDDSTALRIGADRLAEMVAESASLRARLLLFNHVLSVQCARTAAANASAEIPQRLARWLLMCHDRVGGDVLNLTHEFMSMMLAVRRAGVTVTLHLLEGVGAISARRGEVTIRNRGKLEDMAGEIYGVPEAEYRRLLGPLA
ncbi:Crp/Fnr family transcriptional regulator [Sphingosinicella rhizophila]|uniref:Crp/Fnr family transcriptional regulator n=1 Tax=Sphingosinicella rhizophila TaxID=3050082 RepID=A0ABU3Q7J8_9SPHN|nr:Crp/Fnr family transcriptional regulator [Sphingosinicella sp. GR2756]MDT9599377.1 Crp/Fnr family transcriptional regulator [Sphingosinicella sp. GR2756]